MRLKGLFVTGTDTGIGKTRVATELIHTLRRRGLRVAGMKPVASGCERTPAGLRNDDALALGVASGLGLAYEHVNPYALEAAVAPHLAAAMAGISIDLDVISRHFEAICAESDFIVVEGAGGWRVPLGDTDSIATLAARLQLPVVLVVGLRLGCINHGLLTAEAIHADGVALAGWVANHIEPGFAASEANIATLRRHLPAVPYLGALAHRPPGDFDSAGLSLAELGI